MNIGSGIEKFKNNTPKLGPRLAARPRTGISCGSENKITHPWHGMTHGLCIVGRWKERATRRRCKKELPTRRVGLARLTHQNQKRQSTCPDMGSLSPRTRKRTINIGMGTGHHAVALQQTIPDDACSTREDMSALTTYLARQHLWRRRDRSYCHRPGPSPVLRGLAMVMLSALGGLS